MVNVRYFPYSSPLGVIYVASTENGLCSAALSGMEADFRSTLRRVSGSDALRDDAFFLELKAELDAYFSGRRVDFMEPIDWLEGTVFQRSVWEALRKIPYGETRSYKELAQAVGRSQGYRAVGQAVGSNPIPLIVPCHRVINADGSLGGFGGGLALKRQLLELEHHKLVSGRLV